MPADGRWDLTLILLKWGIWWAPNNVSRWDLILILLTWRIWWAPNNASRWDLTLILLTWRIWWAPNNATKWKMRFNSACEVLKCNFIHLNRVPAVFPGEKSERCVQLSTLPPSCVPTLWKSGSLKFRQPSGPLQGGNGRALPLGLITCVQCYRQRYFIHGFVCFGNKLVNECSCWLCRSVRLLQLWD